MSYKYLKFSKPRLLEQVQQHFARYPRTSLLRLSKFEIVISNYNTSYSSEFIFIFVSQYSEKYCALEY